MKLISHNIRFHRAEFRRRLRLLVAGWIAICMSILAPTANAVIVYMMNDEQVRGILVREDPSQIVVSVRDSNGNRTDKLIPRNNISQIIRAVSNERLAELSPDNPQAYRDYAEELTEKTQDPEAQDAAIRLFLIAATLEPEKMGRSCLLGMTAVARSANEERRFRAMAYLLDPDHDRSQLRSPTFSGPTVASLSDEQRRQLSILTRALIDGRVRDAKNMIAREGTATGLIAVESQLSRADIVSLKVGEAVPDVLLRRVIALDGLLNSRSAVVEPEAAGRQVPKFSLAAPEDSLPVAIHSLATLTEFDPQLNRYLGGKWVAK